MKNYLELILLFLMITGSSCDHIILERDNELDPKNPNSKTQKIHIVEAFVNNNIANSAYTLEAAEDLMLDDYSGRIVLLEYHIHDVLPDTYSTMAVNMPELLGRYNLLRAEKNAALPDVYVNGIYDSVIINGIQGAYTVATASDRISSAIDRQSAISYFTIEGSFVGANPASISVVIARLGKNGAANCRVKAAIIESYDANYHKYTVRDLLPEQALNLNNGDVVNKEFQSSTLPDETDVSKLSGVVCIENESYRVLQSAIF